MNYFQAVYRILTFLKAAMSKEAFPIETFNAETFRVTSPEFDNILESLQDEGYIKGIGFVKVAGMQKQAKPTNPRITHSGLEYLQTDAQMREQKDV